MTKLTEYGGWVDPLKGISCDTEILLKEYHTYGAILMKPYQKSPQMMYLGFLIKDRKPASVLDQMPETKRVADEVKKIFDFTSMVYRLMKPVSLYRWHKDTSNLCLHIPIETNPGCMFIYEDKHFHMPANGSVYIASNTRFHTFINAGDTDRIHIVFDKQNNENHLALLKHFQSTKNV